MGEADKQSQPEMTLKRLSFVQTAAIQAVVYTSFLYNMAKDKSGSLKPGIQSVEDKVKTLTGPVYQKHQSIPLELLRFIDGKVDHLVAELNRVAPTSIKQASTVIISASHRALAMFRAVVSELHRSGTIDAVSEVTKTAYAKCESTGKALYDRYENVVEQYAVSAWRSLHQLPLFPQAASVAVPTAVFFVERYNRGVRFSVEKGYRMGAYLPLVPTKKIAKVFQSCGDNEGAGGGKEVGVTAEGGAAGAASN